jgi:hypothetical protein
MWLASAEARTLLVTGAARSGKTTVAREVAARLEEDTRTLTCAPLSLNAGQHRPTYPADARSENSSDTRYVDVSKLGDERISGLKEKLGEVVKDVNMNRPSVLILDGLENLAGVDLPVRPRDILLAIGGDRLLTLSRDGFAEHRLDTDNPDRRAARLAAAAGRRRLPSRHRRRLHGQVRLGCPSAPLAEAYLWLDRRTARHQQGRPEGSARRPRPDQGGRHRAPPA